LKWWRRPAKPPATHRPCDYRSVVRCHRRGGTILARLLVTALAGPKYRRATAGHLRPSVTQPFMCLPVQGITKSRTSKRRRMALAMKILPPFLFLPMGPWVPVRSSVASRLSIDNGWRSRGQDREEARPGSRPPRPPGGHGIGHKTRLVRPVPELKSVRDVVSCQLLVHGPSPFSDGTLRSRTNAPGPGSCPPPGGQFVSSWHGSTSAETRP